MAGARWTVEQLDILRDHDGRRLEADRFKTLFPNRTVDKVRRKANSQ